MTQMTQSERIATLETQVRYLVAQQEDTNRKLDELLALRNKGAGVFWIASVLFGTSLVGTLSMFLAWIRG